MIKYIEKYIVTSNKREGSLYRLWFCGSEIIKSTDISAIEINVRNKYENITKLCDMIKENNLMITKGSDNHELNSGLYDNLDFFEIESTEVEVLCH